MTIYPPRRNGKTTLFVKELKRLRDEGKIKNIVFADELPKKVNGLEAKKSFCDEFLLMKETNKHEKYWDTYPTK